MRHRWIVEVECDCDKTADKILKFCKRKGMEVSRNRKRMKAWVWPRPVEVTGSELEEAAT